MNKSAQTATALLSSAVLASAGLAAVPMLALADEAPAAAVEAQTVNAVSVKAAAEGSFSFTQAGLSSIDYIKAVFQKAAAACANMPAYSVSVSDGIVAVTGPAGTFFAAVADIAENEGAAAYILACACASNLAGGGAIANAQVEGVALSSVAALADAL